MAHIPNVQFDPQAQMNSDFERRLRELPPPGHYRQSAPSLGELRSSHNSIAASFGALHLELTTGAAADKAASIFRNATSSWDRATQDYTLSGDLLSQHYSSIQKKLEHLQMPTLSVPNHSATSLFETLRVEKPRRQEPDARAKILAKWQPKAESLNFPKAPELEKCLNESSLMNDDLREKDFPRIVAQKFATHKGIEPSVMGFSLFLLSEEIGLQGPAILTTAMTISEALQRCGQKAAPEERSLLDFPKEAELEKCLEGSSSISDSFRSDLAKKGIFQAVAFEFGAAHDVDSIYQMPSRISLVLEAKDFRETPFLLDESGHVDAAALGMPNALIECAQGSRKAVPLDENDLKFPQDEAALARCIQQTWHAPESLKDYYDEKRIIKAIAHAFATGVQGLNATDGVPMRLMQVLEDSPLAHEILFLRDEETGAVSDTQGISKAIIDCAQ